MAEALGSFTPSDRHFFTMGMLKKAASGVLALLPNLRAHRLAALRGVRAHVLRVCSARQKSCSLACGRARLGALGLGGSDDGRFEHSLSLMLVAFPGAFMGSRHENIQQAHSYPR